MMNSTNLLCREGHRAFQLDLAGLLLELAEDGRQEGRFPGPDSADDSHEAALLNPEVDTR